MKGARVAEIPRIIRCSAAEPFGVKNTSDVVFDDYIIRHTPFEGMTLGSPSEVACYPPVLLPQGFCQLNFALSYP